MEAIKVILTDLPSTIRGITAYYFADDGMEYYTIFLNSRLNNTMLCNAYDHEISHINNKDFDNMVAINELENLRHAG